MTDSTRPFSELRGPIRADPERAARVEAHALYLRHLVNARTRGMPHEVRPEMCWCTENVAVLQEEVERLHIENQRFRHAIELARVVIDAMMTGDTSDAWLPLVMNWLKF